MDREKDTVQKLFIIIGIFTIILLNFGVSLLFIKRFNIFLWMVPVLLVISILVSGFFLKRIHSLRSFINKNSLFDITMVVIIGTFVVINGFFYHETISGARDDGYYSLNSILITKNNSMFIEEQRFQPPGTQKLGDKDNTYVLGFLPGYSVYLAIFYKWVGISGIFYANTFLLFLSLTSLYFLGKLVVGKLAGILTTLFFSISYPTIWFSRRTNNENLHLFLIWFSVFLLIKGIKTKNIKYLFLSFLPLSFQLSVRGEAIMFFLIAFIIFIIYNIYLVIKGRFSRLNYLNWFFLTTIIITIWGFINYIYFQNMSGGKDYISGNVSDVFISIIDSFKRMLNSFTSRTISLLNFRNVSDSNGLINTTPPDFTTYVNKYMFDVFSYYYLLPFIGTIFLIGKKILRWEIICIILFISPELIYLINPSITIDHPWMMRRLWPATLPLIFLLASIGIASLKNHYLKATIFLLLFLPTLRLSIPIMFFAEQRGAVSHLEEFSKSLDAGLIRMTGYEQQWAFPLYVLFGKNTIQTWGTDKEEIRRAIKNFKTVQLATSGSDLDKEYPYITSYSFTLNEIQRTCIFDKQFFPYYELKEACKDTPPQKTTNFYHKINLFKIDDKEKELKNL